MTATTIHDIITTGQQTAHAAPVALSADALAMVPLGQIFAQQGDLYFSRLGGVPAAARIWPYAHGQLAPGDTQGSRHTVDLARVRLWVLPSPTALQGPIIDAPLGVEIAHPEHGHLIFPPGVYQVTFQRAYAEELRELRRVAD